MKLQIDDWQAMLTLLSIGVNEKAVTPQGDCILLEDSNMYAFNGTFYVNVPLEESLDIRTALHFRKLATFINSMKSGSSFTIKPKDKKLLLKCGKIKQQLSMEDEVLLPYSVYQSELSEAKWKKLGLNFKETLMQKAYTSPNQNDVLNAICYNKKGVYSSNTIEVYYTPDSPIKTKEDVLMPAVVADTLSKVAEPFTHYTICDTIIAFRTENGTEIAFPKLVDSYQPIVNQLLKAEVKGQELDLGDNDLSVYMNSSSAVAEKCTTGTDKYKLTFAGSELMLSTSSDKGKSVFKVEVHADTEAELCLSSSVLTNISQMGGVFTYDGKKLIKIDSQSFTYLAAVVLE